MKKYILLVCAVMCATIMFAQEQETAATKYKAGDVVMVRRETTHYLTGQEPSRWVYFVEHTILQVGGKRFPQGILLKGIMSWVGPDDIMLKNSDECHEESVRRAEEINNMSESERRALAAYSKSIGAEAITVDEERARQDSIMRAEQDSIHQAQMDSIAQAMREQEEALRRQAERAKAIADSLAAENARLEEEIKAQQDSILAADSALAAMVDTTAEAAKSRLLPMHRFSIGVRGGVASLMHQTDAMGSWRPGFDAMLDLQYAYYFGAKEGKKVNMGILTGLSIGWAQSGLKSAVDTTYTVATSDGNIDYQISADKVKESDGQLQLEIPLMFTLLTEKGMFFNVGPRFLLPVMSHYNQNMTNPNIVAYFPEEEVTVTNEVITGLVEDNQMKSSGKWKKSPFNLLLTAELGYEWMLKSSNSLGLGVYANYSVLDAFKNSTDNKSLIDVTAPSGSTPADVSVLSATDTYTKDMGYFDVGLKLVYHFNFFKK